MSGFDLVIFDCDGVLVDSEVLSCTSLAGVLTRHGLPITVDEIVSRFLGRSVAAVHEHYVATTGRSVPESFPADLQATVEEAFQGSLRPIPGIADLLAALRTPFCLASSSSPERIKLSLRLTGLSGFFGERVFSSSMVKNGKPAPDLFLHAAREMGMEPARCVVIEDSPNGVLAGKRAGMTVWGFTGGSHYASLDGRKGLLDAGADRVFASMADIPLTQAIHAEP
ncbi:haloacid dehalogenase superfamily, subfamily IA, variant 3 with third motif having DD or ED [Faunimonas pinastri]|uniref:Haloacid dehalogenase superfamily, subfamily IA, variant 3 with third motif having DD or ED n=1 Tax=Faunimonas pinastri TaxID=1855383 RepID=A0A1H9C3F2_9HYPH|nr:HAD family hydrolase [Faunimonas pinastri]SEP95491.1 haloacid dehalogenase superfamily, subfamily IA, variant 3 with third motif having DD or ED [Faunimonas pinastri]